MLSVSLDRPSKQPILFFVLLICLLSLSLVSVSTICTHTHFFLLWFFFVLYACACVSFIDLSSGFFFQICWTHQQQWMLSFLLSFFGSKNKVKLEKRHRQSYLFDISRMVSSDEREEGETFESRSMLIWCKYLVIPVWMTWCYNGLENWSAYEFELILLSHLWSEIGALAQTWS